MIYEKALRKLNRYVGENRIEDLIEIKQYLIEKDESFSKMSFLEVDALWRYYSSTVQASFLEVEKSWLLFFYCWIEKEELYGEGDQVE